MQTLSRLPSNNLHFLQAKRPSFNCRTSAFNSSTISFKQGSISAAASVAAAPSGELRTHLANLEKILQTQAPEPVEKRADRGSTPDNRGGALLERLNLARIWPERKAAEEMSPRHLNRLQRLLSMTHQEYSPRNNIARRWLEYHGANDWAGLLDPLDENLRREVVRYGEFVQAAYHAFHSHPATSEGEPASSPRHVALPDRSYKVTKSLYATSSLGFPKWFDEVAPDLGWMTQRSSWVGYVAVCDDKEEIRRMGRRDIVIALRGTSTCLEWMENVRAQLVPMADDHNPTHGDPRVECGFQSLYKTPGEHMASLAESVVEEVKRLINMYKGETLSITVTGHSLGAALALLVANELSTCAQDVPPIAVFSFGGPKVGNKDFADHVVAKNVKVLRVVNDQDLITKVPGIFPDISILNEKLKNSKISSVLHNTPLAYSHVGTELRVSTTMSPFLKPDADVACCHDLEAYLHLVDGFLSSSCPSRPNAKRSLVRLLNDQRSNVKKLYTSKVKALSLSVEKEGALFPSCLPSPS